METRSKSRIDELEKPGGEKGVVHPFQYPSLRNETKRNRIVLPPSSRKYYRGSNCTSIAWRISNEAANKTRLRPQKSVTSGIQEWRNDAFAQSTSRATHDDPQKHGQCMPDDGERTHLSAFLTSLPLPFSLSSLFLSLECSSY